MIVKVRNPRGQIEQVSFDPVNDPDIWIYKALRAKGLLSNATFSALIFSPDAVTHERTGATLLTFEAA